MSDFTAMLFARPSFFEGVSRLVDFGGSLNVYNASPSADEADRNALAADWQQVGADIDDAAKQELQPVATPPE